MINLDFNVLERAAKRLREAGRPQDAIKIYLFMADGDESLDAGYLGKKLAECYVLLGDTHAAKYWYGRAIEENPEVYLEFEQLRNALPFTGIEDLLEVEDFAPRAKPSTV